MNKQWKETKTSGIGAITPRLHDNFNMLKEIKRRLKDEQRAEPTLWIRERTKQNSRAERYRD